MSVRVTFELTDTDLKHFRQEMERVRRQVRSAEDEEILEAAEEALSGFDTDGMPGFVRERLNGVQDFVAMIRDEDWGLPGTERAAVLSALAYLSDPEDMIPDDIPGIGLLDDAIMLELVLRELRHELEAYRDFREYRERQMETGLERDELARRLEQRRGDLFDRMRRRRQKDREEAARADQPAPLW